MWSVSVTRWLLRDLREVRRLLTPLPPSLSWARPIIRCHGRVLSGILCHMLLVLAQPPVSSDTGWTQWVPVASAAVALLALLVALSNRNTSRRALVLSMQQEERRAARLDITLADSASWRRSGASRWVGVKILAVNPTDRDAAIVGAELHIAYTLPTGHAMTVKVGHRTTGDDFPGDVTALDLPVRLESNGAVAGWLTFELPAGLFPHGAGIQRYDAVLQDSRGIAVTVSASVLREVEHDQTSDDQAADETSGRSR